ncbi:unnamed protein product [Absidia cylindrospora]
MTHRNQQQYSPSDYGSDLINLQQGASTAHNLHTNSPPPQPTPSSSYPAAAPTQPRNPPLSAAAPAHLQGGHQLKRTDTFASDGASIYNDTTPFDDEDDLQLLSHQAAIAGHTNSHPPLLPLVMALVLHRHRFLLQALAKVVVVATGPVNLS